MTSVQLYLVMCLAGLYAGTLPGLGPMGITGFTVRRLRTNRNCTNLEDPACETLTATEQQRVKELAVHYHTELIKQHILSKLRLTKRPNVSKEIPREVFNKAIQQLNQAQDNSSPRGYYAEVRQYISFSEKADDVNTQRMKFKISGSDTGSHPEVTQLKLYMLVRYKKKNRENRKGKQGKSEKDPPGFVELKIYRHSLASKDIPQSKTRELVRTLTLKVKRTRWQKVVLPAFLIQDLFKNKESATTAGENSNIFLQLEIVCTNCGDKIEPILATREKKRKRRLRKLRKHRKKEIRLNKRRPFLVVITKQRPKSRRTRNVDCEFTGNGCCKKSLYISFRELGWNDWIIAPHGYYANFCQGGCEDYVSPERLAHSHSSVVQHYKGTSPVLSDILSCCAPRKMAPLSILFLDPEANIIKTDLEDMIVEECGCA